MFKKTPEIGVSIKKTAGAYMQRAKKYLEIYAYSFMIYIIAVYEVNSPLIPAVIIMRCRNFIKPVLSGFPPGYIY